MSHTPTPWIAGLENGYVVVQEKATGVIVAVCGSSNVNPSQEDAKFIVRACNAYDEMLEDLMLAKAAFKAIVKNAEKEGCRVNDLADIADAEIINLEEAIAKAEGK